MVISIISTSYIQYNTNKDTKINVYSDSSTSFVYLQDKDCRCIILNDNCYSVRAVLQKTLTNELDMLIFTGNDSCDFYKVMDDLKDEGIIINNIYVNEKIANEKYARNINAFDNMSIGDININVKTFKAKSKNAKLHYAAIIESDECKILYLDPRSLREGAFDNTDFDYVVSSKWSKSRMKNIQNVSFNNLIIKDSKYLYSEFVDALEQNGSKLYNINDLGAISLMIESEEE
jgi:hypothetical protein